MGVYVKPGAGDLDQCDIVGPVSIRALFPWWPNDKSEPAIIVTPACDIAQNKVDYHRVCILRPLPFVFLGLCEAEGAEVGGDKIKLSNTKKDKVTQNLRRIITNAFPRYHFLPREEGFFETDYVVDFQLIGSIQRDGWRKERKLAAVDSPYKEELIHRYSHYNMRIGTPDWDRHLISNAVARCLDYLES